MEQTTDLHVRIDGVDRSYPRGTRYQTIAEDVQAQYPHRILLVNREGRLCELSKSLDRDCTLKMVTTVDKPGMQTYERSAVLLMLKAFYDVVGRAQIDRVTVEYSISHALFVRAAGRFSLDQALLEQVEARMRALVSLALPIQKHSVNTWDAVDFFQKNGMPDKARLLSYRISSHVNLYTLDGFTDYFYGYMVPDTSYLTCFGLEPYEDGFVLRLPDQADPARLAEFQPSAKVFRTLHDASDLAMSMGISTVGELNTAISEGQATQMVLAREAMMEKEIGDIAHEIAARKDVRFVMIAGPSSSGKTTFSHRLSTQLIACGMHPHPIATDNYFKNRADTPRDENGQYDFEGLGAMDVEQFNADMSRLLRGETVELPRYNFIKGVREYNGDTLTLGPQDILVIEGIHCLNESFTHALPKESKYKIYISCLTTLNVDDHNRIPTTDARLLRRIERDARTRGYGARATIRMWPSVRRGEERNIFPYQDSADRIFNSALIYETALLRPYVEPLLFGVPRDCEEYLEAKRLLKFLSYSLPLPADDVPKTSLMREFIGGGCYQV
ncbi:nucleoside kinase [Intestinimonas sp.]|uniref:nucleoside kinase n=1 Tax=Intestinimonas sp. TaxID=1965293 RepID=UPI002621E0FF|nr:nucleoside kinase [Intestinimonas sp.]